MLEVAYFDFNDILFTKENSSHICHDKVTLITTLSVSSPNTNTRFSAKNREKRLYSTLDACESLQGCFECTDWTCFSDSADNVHTLTDTVCSYINFCVHNVIPTKTVKIYPNNKPWVSKNLKGILNEKKRAFRDGDENKLKLVQIKLKKEIRKGKKDYKDKIESEIKTNNMKKVWEGINRMSGCSKNKSSEPVSTSVAYANELNSFYCRFDKHDFTQQRQDITDSLRNSNSVGYRVGQNNILKLMKKVNPNKGAGPDGVFPRVINLCAEQLCFITTYIFNLSLSDCIVPKIWKMSSIIPVPKRHPVSVMNDLRPIAMTSSFMKLFERAVLNILEPEVANYIDPLQFAYRKNRGVDDALLYLLNRCYSHLEKAGSSIRLMFYDFSSAFNTIQPHILAQKLSNMKIAPPTILWILDYLTNRPQVVKLTEDVTSQINMTDCGCPQGTVLSPFLFSLYTSDYRSSSDSVFMIKYADDSIQCGLCTNSNYTPYFDEISTFTNFCDENFLELNVGKTKEIIIDFRKNAVAPNPVNVKGHQIDQTKTYKYLGVTLNNTLTWTDNTDMTLKKVNPRLYCLRKLNSFGVCQELLQLFYSSSIMSILSFGIVSWGNGIAQSDRERLDRITRKAGRVVGRSQDDIQTITNKRVQKKLSCILKDDTHPLRPDFENTRIARSGRFRLPLLRTERFKRSFFPCAITHFNQHFHR